MRHSASSREARRTIDPADALPGPLRGSDRPADTASPDWTASGAGQQTPTPSGHLEIRTATGLEKVTAAVVATAGVHPGDNVIDLGCGPGQVSLALAERGARVLAIDGSQALLGRLKAVAQHRGLAELEVLARPIHSLSLPPESADVIVTSYALHRLRDADKLRLMAAAFQWLRPGGTLIVADMMFGRGATSQDRAIIKTKVRSLARKGIGGWWRILKNSYRYLLRVKQHPVAISSWTTFFARSGFTGITASRIVNEAGLVTGKRPVPPIPAQRGPEAGLFPF